MIRNAITVCLIWLAGKLTTFNEKMLLVAKKRVRQDILNSDGANKK